MKQRIAEGWRGGGGGPLRASAYRLTIGERALLIGASAINALASIWNLLLWCKQGTIWNFLSCQFSAYVALWIFLKQKKYW